MVSDGTGVDYVALAFWVDRAPAMVQALIVQSFQSSGRIAQVGTIATGCGPSSCCGPICARSSSTATAGRRSCGSASTPRCYRMPRRDLVGQQSFAADMAPEGQGIDAVVAAFDAALGRVLKELVGWTLRTGESAGAQKVTTA